jgi:hypothetical protein
MNSRFLLFAGLLLFIAGSPSYAAPPSMIRAHYDLYYGGIWGATMDDIYTLKQGHYKIESTSRAIGLVALFKPETIHVTSKGMLTSHGLQPVTFTSTRKLGTEHNVRAEFDWPRQRITLTNRSGQHTLPLPAGTQDRLSAMYQFMFLDLANTDRLDFHMTDGDKLDIYNYLITHGQSVTIPLGKFDALYVESAPEAGSKRTEIWLATQHSNFPYKMVVTDRDGNKISQVLTKIDFVP